MTGKLAIFVPAIGAVSETFIRRHLTEIAPGSTVAVTFGEPPEGAAWTADMPTLRVARPPESALAARLANLRWRLTGSTGRLWKPDGTELARVSAFLAEHQVTTILFEYLDVWLGFLGLAAGHRAVAAGHGYDFSRSLRDGTFRRGYRALEALDAVLVPSEYAAGRLREIGLPRALMRVIPYSVEMADPAEVEERSVTRCVAAGRLVRKKAPLSTLEAFSLAAERRPDLRLQLIGSGPLTSDVQRFVQSHSLEDVVDRAGSRPHDFVLDAIRSAMCFVQHSVTDPRTGDQEGMPVAILEAMAASTPVLATRHAGIPEAISDGENGLLVDEGDVAAMADRLVTLADDAALRQRLGEAARQTVAARFTVETQIRRLREELRVGI